VTWHDYFVGIQAVATESGPFVLKATVIPTEGASAFTAEVTLIKPMVKIVDRDDPTKTWADAVTSDNKTVYAGKESGDMISWAINGFDGGKFTWMATGPTGDIISGPIKSSKNEWKIANGDSDTANDWIKWKPGKYKIKCIVQPIDRASFEVEMDQEVGWRTETLLVIGQIVPTHAHDNDEPAFFPQNGGTDLSSPSIAYRRAILYDLVEYIPLPPHLIEALAIAPLPITGKLTEGWFGYWALLKSHDNTPRRPFSNSHPSGFGAVTDRHRLWMTQHVFNISYDRPSVQAKFAEDEFIGIQQARQYRLLHRYQAKFEVQSGLIKGESFIAIKPIGDQGTTKIYAGFEPGTIPFIDNPSYGITEEPFVNPLSNKEGKVSTDAKAISSYLSIRVGDDGRNANWRLFGKDVPWIFSEIIFEVTSEGSVNTRLRTSTDIKWKDGVVTSGTNPFNNLNIYKRTIDTLTGQVNYERQGEVLGMDGHLESFLNSSSTAWPEPDLEPEIK